jgi:hypothetical protein
VLGSEGGKGLGSGLCCEQWKENEERLWMFGIFILTLGVELGYKFYLNLGQ